MSQSKMKQSKSHLGESCSIEEMSLSGKEQSQMDSAKELQAKERSSRRQAHNNPVAASSKGKKKSLS